MSENSSNNESVTNPQITEYYNEFNNWLINPVAIIVMVILVIGLFFIAKGINKNKDVNLMDSLGSEPKKGNSYTIIIVVILGLLFAYIIINFFQYFMNIDLMASIKNIFEPEADMTINVSGTPPPAPVPEITLKKQVFNIPGNTYSYPDAKALCTAYGANLATYSQVEDSYNEGGEWCNYGWSDGQMALFPTQQASYDKLQGIEGHENDCGRPGINGGYIANPKVAFGVNCYGYKPKMTEDEQDLMSSESHYPLTKKDLAMQQRVDYWKGKVDEILVSPFNYNNWSKI